MENKGVLSRDMSDLVRTCQARLRLGLKDESVKLYVIRKDN